MVGVEIVTQPYFLGGEHRKVLVNGEQVLSIIPQPSAMGVHKNLYEIASTVGGGLEVLGAFCSEQEISKIVGEQVLAGRF